MTKRMVLAGLTLLLVATAAMAQAPVALQYNAKLGEIEESAFASSLADIQLNGAPVPFQLDASGTIKVEVVAVDDEKGTCTERVTVSNLLVNMAGQEQQPDPLPPTDITLDRQGKVVSVETPGQTEEEGAAGFDSMTARLVPALGMLALFPQFPADKVEAGATWTLEEDRELPVAGETRVITENGLAEVAEGVAKLTTSFASDLPPFEMNNPFLDGPMQVQGGKVSAQEISREWSLERGVVTRAEGDVKIQLIADIGFGMPVPIDVTANFKLCPPEPADDEPAKG
jgi:hypothetical protein